MTNMEAMDVKNICRVFLVSGNSVHFIFQGDMTPPIDEMLTSLSKYEIQPFDNFPFRICEMCLNDVKVAYKIKLKFEESHRKLTKMLNGNQSVINISESCHQEKFTQTDETSLHPCERCENKFLSFDSLKCHRKTDHNGSPICCSFCSRTFDRVSYLKTHIAVFHPESGYKNHNQCEICERQFTRQAHVLRHLAIVHNIKPTEVKQDKISENKEEFINTSKENDNSNAIEDTNNELDKGNVELQTHTMMNKNKKSLICPECGLRCRNNKSLTVHIRRHTGEKPFNCKFCSKAFTRVDDLRLHEKYHTGEKSHFCETCGKGFQRKYALTIHLRVHSGEKPYKCPHCPQAFAQNNDLKIHIRRHTGERFHCDICNAAFLQDYKRRQHKLQEHGLYEVSAIQRLQKFNIEKEQKSSFYINAGARLCQI